MKSHTFRDEPFEMYGIQVLVSGSFYPGRSAKLWGPPESCYPGEDDELEIERIDHAGQNIMDLVNERFLECCNAELLNRVSERVAAQREEAMERRAEEREDLLLEQAR